MIADHKTKSRNACCGYTTEVKGIYFDEEGLYVTLVQVTVRNRRVHHLAAISSTFLVYGGWIPDEWRLEDVVMLFPVCDLVIVRSLAVIAVFQ